MGSQPGHEAAVRYRGFLLLPQANQTWLVRPERSPMLMLPFRTPSCSLEEVKSMLNRRLSQKTNLFDAA
ncbi:MAG: hypothetical protein AB8A49_09115 [Prochlorococcus sp.]|jgi:hypothetical protein|nr:hypothetical protein [Prochlorococcaceae cyanobacterium ETNP2_MAG_10]MDP6196747.1 hypothetical protein [Prochlorococcaceae cyanobacterium ETNP18_MAG_17]MDP6321438.1 hypothetical protein [Prochlorococcaceae cyanobacterium ETNP14_MAG_5]MDP7328080.1 hypothetical protein [Prochlorococcaceae cyanobacterium ETNP7_MAG_30]